MSFSVRKGMKVALMGQNGAGKSTLFKLITKKIEPTSGEISIDKRLVVAIAHQVIAPADMTLTVEQYFQKWLGNVEHYELNRKLSNVLNVVNLHAPLDKIIKSFSGGQQARLLLASALIQDPDLLLLDEPTNNLDHKGIDHLTSFLMNYQKSVIVISHDAEFLNAFTEGVLYLDSFTKKIEQYAGDYNDVVEQIAVRIEREHRQNAQMERGIQENKDRSNFFAHKGGKMRLVAKKMREKAEKMESEKVAVRREDKTIRPFVIPVQEGLVNEDMKISSFTIMKDHKEITKASRVFLVKGKHLLIKGPNGIGKSTLIESLARGTAQGVVMTPGIRIGYYRQDFSTLDFNDTVYESFTKAVKQASGVIYEQQIRSVAAGFLITSEHIYSKIGTLSEGQKGLVAFAQLVLQKPGLLILDEPTNHINFRHLPRIAEALSVYEGMMILVSHVPEFVSQIHIDEVLDLEK
ncbi:MAG: ATP-binding cassette domain-containing protein [Candidatus Roizmanbacteria bacterium]|nr:ATP-binding cassette domain-containing protein [Candidatus Roizmanbacteria bacterium]